MKEWYSASELAGLPGMPGDKSNVNRRANRENWSKRNKEGIRGVAYEFHIASLPQETREALGQQVSEDITQIDVELLAELLESVELLSSKRSKKLSPSAKAKIVAILYRISITHGLVSETIIDETIGLIA
ncbi:MAG: DNA-binding protein [Pseudomonadota bacterium]